jgi:carbonic anhydrase
MLHSQSSDRRDLFGNYALVDAVARQNVLLTIANIRERSSVLRELESKGNIKIAGSMYNLETSKVEFLA